MRWRLILTIVALPACGPAPLIVPELHAHANVVEVEAGQRYALTVAAPTGDLAIGHTWSGAALIGSPLERMARRPIVLKADDFGGPLDDNAAWFIETVDTLDAVAGLGIITSRYSHHGPWAGDIITSRVVAFEEARTIYAPIRDHDFELWFHGHTHPTGAATPEFMGRGLDSEIASFGAGRAVGRDSLGVEFRSFGAPENAFDVNTSLAIATDPEIAVWLFGPTDPSASPVLVLPRLVDLEIEPGRVFDPPEFQSLLAAALLATPEAPAITLQVHPFMFAPGDRERCRTVLESLAADDRFRFATPFEVWSWRTDAAAIRLTRTTATDYLLDLSEAQLDHRLELPVDGSATVTPLP